MSLDIKHDSIEDSIEYKNISKELEEKIKLYASINSINLNTFGSCHQYWAIKKEILKKEYDIEWQSPSELNPEITFD